MTNTEIKRIKETKKITHCYIYKGGYYRPEKAGYTFLKHKAGVYTKEDAIQSALKCRDLTLIPVDLYEHNEMIKNEISDLVTRIF